MSISKVTEYFYVTAPTISTDVDVFAHLAKDDVNKAFELADEALQNYKQNGSNAEIAAAMATCAEVALACDDVDQANEHAEAALGMAKKAGDVKVEAAAMNIIAKVMNWWAPEEAVSRAKDAMDVAKASGDVHVRACIHHTLAQAMAANSQGNQAIVVVNDMVGLFAGSDAVGEACALICLAELHMLTGAHTVAISTATSAAAILERLGDVPRQAQAAQCAASAALSSADTAAEGFELADKALSLCESAGDTKSQVTLKLNLAEARLRAEEYVEAEDWAEDAQAQCKKIGDVNSEAEAAQVLATVRLNIAIADSKGDDEPDMASATEASRDALHLFRKIGNRKGEASAMYKLAQVRYNSGAGDMAKMAAEEAQAMFRELGDAHGEAGAVLLIAHVMHKEQALDGAKRNATKAFTLYQNIGDNEGMESCTEFIDKVKGSQTEKTREDKKIKKTVSDTGLVKLVNSVEDSTHLLSYFADMNEEEDTELGEFDLKEWGSEMNMLKIQS